LDSTPQLEKNLVKHLLFQDFSGSQVDSLRIPMNIIQQIDIQISLVVFLRFLSKPVRPNAVLFTGQAIIFMGYQSDVKPRVGPSGP
jgi:hypothetical protein